MTQNIFHRIKGFISLLIVYSLHSFCQEPPIIWGEIPRADLEMRSYPADTNASAVILCDYGESHLNHELRNVYKRHLRVKILTSDGYSYGTHTFTIYGKKKKKPLKILEGITYSLNEQGEIVKNELRPEDLFSKEVDTRKTNYWFTMPNLKPGCIFEVRYTIESWSPFLRDWTFQCSEPTRWSEYRIQFPTEYISYSAIHQGDIPYTIRENTTTMLMGGTMPFGVMRWAIKDVPALRKEPYMTSVNDYFQKVYVQISAYKHFFSGTTQQFVDTWATFGKELKEDEEFGEKPESTRSLRKLAEQITFGITFPQEKMRAIYSWVAKSIVWTQDNTPFAWKEVDDILETKKGNSADINFLVLSLLKSIDIKGDPVILSTRENGKFKEAYPVISQFDYVVGRASIDSQYYYLDATEPNRPMELLPIKILNMKGIVIGEDALEWMRFTSPKRYSNISAATLTLQKDGSLFGTVEDLYRDYGSLEVRNNLKDKKDIDIAKEFFETDIYNITLDSVYLDAKDSIDLPLKLKGWISSPDYAQCNGDLIYFNPHFLHRLKDNPLKSERRNFPLDYACQQEYSTIANITFPDSFEINESPISRNLTVGSNLAFFSRKVMVKGNQIRVQYRWEIRETEIDTIYYTRMREFYAQIIAIESEQFVFARIKPSVPSAPQTPKTAIIPLKKSPTSKREKK